jgi:glutathione S-transferase
MITVHHLENSRSQRILWLLEELEIPYEIKSYKRDPATMLAPAALKAVHPLGKSPVITDGDVVVAESGAIIEHVLSTYGQGRLLPGDDGEDRRRYTFWLHYAEGSAMPPLLLKLVFSALPERSPGLIRPLVRLIAERAQHGFIDPQIALHTDFWESALGKSHWFAGEDFTAADVQMSFPVEAAASSSLLGASYPKLLSFLERIHARPAYQRALARGGPYAFGPKAQAT